MHFAVHRNVLLFFCWARSSSGGREIFEAAETMLDASQRTATAGLALDSAEAEKARAAVLQMIPMLVSSLIERMNSNTLSSGAGFRDDELIQSDLRTCRNALTALSES